MQPPQPVVALGWATVRKIDHGGRMVADRAISGRSARRFSRRSVKGRAPAKGEDGDGWARHHEFMMRERRTPSTERLCAAAAAASAVRVGAARHWNGSALPPRPGLSPAV